MGKLADAQNSVSAKETALAAALSGSQHFEDVTITLAPGKTITAKMTPIGVARALDIEGEVLRAMAERSIAQDVMTQGEYELERALRVLAETVRDPVDTSQPVGTIADWGKLGLDTVGSVWSAYGDMRERIDPMSVPLTETEGADIRDAISKKNATLLRYFGARRLASYMLTTADPPASSATPTSNSGDFSPAS
jgi:hypothetical protein